MRSTTVLLAYVALTFAASICFAAQPTIAEPDPDVEEVLVRGEHPGPGLWRVMHGEHTLWILGTHSPLPRWLDWRSQEIEMVVSEAQEVIGSYSASFKMSGGDPFTKKGSSLRTLLPSK